MYLFYFYAVMMIIAMIIFTTMTYFYEYADFKSEDYPLKTINNINKEKKPRRNKASSDNE